MKLSLLCHFLPACTSNQMSPSSCLLVSIFVFARKLQAQRLQCQEAMVYMYLNMFACCFALKTWLVYITVQLLYTCTASAASQKKNITCQCFYLQPISWLNRTSYNPTGFLFPFRCCDDCIIGYRTHCGVCIALRCCTSVRLYDNKSSNGVQPVK